MPSYFPIFSFHIKSSRFLQIWEFILKQQKKRLLFLETSFRRS
nr:MAG TPA: hypothetical protein [Caudoviricetes sp.]